MGVSRRRFAQWALLSAGAAALPPRGIASTPAEQDDPEFQPFAAHMERVLETLRLVGEPLPESETENLKSALRNSGNGSGAAQEILDRHCLFQVEINPEDRVSMTMGQAKPELMEQGWRTFLVKVVNQAGDTSSLRIYSPQALPAGRKSDAAIVPAHDESTGAVDAVDAEQRWLELDLWQKPPMQATLSGLSREYCLLQLYSRDKGRREATFRAETSAGALTEQYPFFYSLLPVQFNCLPSATVDLQINDFDGELTTASLLIQDSLGRVYPTQSKRLVPDLWFQRHIYRRSGESIRLPAGRYLVQYGRGPEYLKKSTELTFETEPASPLVLTLDRWVRPSQFGYYSGDTHVHAAGCSHYESPSEGVTPDVMDRQVEGEALNVGDVLTWGPGYYYQRQFFTGHIWEPSEADRKSNTARMSPTSLPSPTGLLRYDVEVSGFPSSPCGHLVLLRLADQSYPGTTSLDQWPSWNLPILQWAKSQGAVVGYAHSGFGLVVDSNELPNLLMPRFDGIGANEFIVDVTHQAVDFISVCDTLPIAELNIWYHTLNCGFRTVLAGETDFPCLTDERVGAGRTYVHLASAPKGDSGYDNWIAGLKEGLSYCGDGRSHIFGFTVSEGNRSAADNRFEFSESANLTISALVCGRLEPETTVNTERIRQAPAHEKPQWHLERARIGASRKVAVELIVNGLAIDRVEFEADGTVRPVTFRYAVKESSWIALRIMPSSHTNPFYLRADGKPIRASRPSAKWCREAVDVCWEQKSLRIRPSESGSAKAAYDHARSVYDSILAESQ
jgi:hypothetical protein